MRVGFIGLGRMGSGMACNLVKNGVELSVFDISADATVIPRAAGARVASGISELARECEVVFTSLPGPVQVEQVLLGPDGVFANLRPGLTLFELSTSSLALTRRIHAIFASRQAVMLDAPVSGGPAGAAGRELAIWVGGTREAYDQHLGLLQAMSNAPRYVGPIGSGTVAKLAHNMLGYSMMLSMAEVFSMAVKAGVEPLELWETLRSGMVGRGSPLNLLTRQFLPGQYEPPAFALKLAHKDVTLATTMARELGVPLRLSTLVLEEMTEALAQGWGEQDSRAFLKLQLQRAGVNIAVEPDRLHAVINAYCANVPHAGGATTNEKP